MVTGAYVPIIHLSCDQFRVGDVVQPGIFGRNIRELHNGTAVNGRVFVIGMVARELLFELVRRDVNPTAPSRLNCIFACPSQSDAEKYARTSGVDSMHAYEIEPISNNTGRHVAAISHCTMTAGPSFLNDMEPKAHRYWRGEPGDDSKGWEILFDCPAKIVRAL